MGFCHDKYPGEWYGHHAISIMLRVIKFSYLKLFIQDLNKMYQPIPDFQICIFRDGNIYFDKLKKLAIMDGKKFQLM